MSRSRDYSLESAVRFLDRLLHNAAMRNYDTAKLYRKARHWVGGNKDALLVYTVGKVGSSAVAASLKDSGLDRQILHLHWLVREHLDRDDALYRKQTQKFRRTPFWWRFWPEYLWLGEYMAKRVRQPPRSGGPWRIVTLVRDPVARNISSFFENLEIFFDFDLPRAIEARGEKQVFEELIALFLESYLGESFATQHDGDPLTWFDEELKAVFDVDVYGSPFPTDRGYEIYRTRKAEVLLLRLEDLGRCAEDAFRAFLGLESLTLQRRNAGEDKSYSGVYKRFLENIELPESYLDRLYESRYARQFYTEDELATFRARWERRRP
jgi:Putative capsular polysaccharide synthesis protein